MSGLYQAVVKSPKIKSGKGPYQLKHKGAIPGLFSMVRTGKL